MNIKKETLVNENISIELFTIFYEDRKNELENDFISQDKIKDFTLFCIEEWKEFDNALFTE
jgi:hypothetical protein